MQRLGYGGFGVRQRRGEDSCSHVGDNQRFNTLL
jgi:hypothetical protein